MNYKNKMLAFLFAAIMFPLFVSADPGDGGEDPLDEDPGQEETPIDGASYLLVTAAAAYGMRKLRKKTAIYASGEVSKPTKVD